MTDLSFAIFDQLVSAERLKMLGYPEVVRYRKESESPREALLEYLAALQAPRRRDRAVKALTSDDDAR